MELRDYLRMLRRGWRTVLLLVVICAGGALGYVHETAKQYSTSAVIVILPKDPKTFTDLADGSQFTVDRASTYAQIIESPQVLGRAAQQLGSSETAQQLEGQVSAAAPTNTSIIQISATASTAESAENIANAVATSAADLIPTIAFGTAPKASLVTVDVLRTANGSSVSVSPSRSRILGIGVALGLVLGLILTIARQSLDTRLRVPRDVQGLALAPLLGVLPRLRRRQRAGIMVRDDPTALAGESYRALRTNLGDLGGPGSRSLLVAGVSDAASSAQVALNLAWSLAQTGRSVLFLDLDMRRSPVNGMLGIDGGEGMAEVLAGSVRLHEVLHATSQPTLHVATAGVATSNPADLLSSARMARVLSVAKSRCEAVVVHVPPLLSFTDGALVAIAADKTVVTISAGLTRAAEVTEAMEILRNARTEPIGFVLCGVRGNVRKAQRLLRTGAPSRPSELPEASPPPPAVEVAETAGPFERPDPFGSPSAPGAPVGSAARSEQYEAYTSTESTESTDALGTWAPSEPLHRADIPVAVSSANVPDYPGATLAPISREEPADPHRPHLNS